MNQQKFEEVFRETIERCANLLGVKAKEYASGKDRLHNFKRGAALLGRSPHYACLASWQKHLVSILDMIDNADMGVLYPIKLWDEKLLDSINYHILLRAIIVEKNSAYPEGYVKKFDDEEQEESK